MAYHGVMTIPRKSATKKAVAKPVRKAAKPVGARKATMTLAVKDTTEGPESGVPELKSVTFMGREMPVKIPEVEQLIAWDSVFGKLQGVSAEGVTLERASKILRRCWIVIEAILVNEDDVDWLTDRRMDGTVTIEDGYKIVTQATEAYGITAPKNRAARRAKA